MIAYPELLDNLGYASQSRVSAMKAYSRDLRQKIVDAYNNKEGSYRQLAKRFRVSLSFVQNLLKRYREVGTLEPKPHGGGQTPKLTPEQRALVPQLVAEDEVATLDQLCERLEQRTGVRVSRATMGRILKHFQLPRSRQRAEGRR